MTAVYSSRASAGSRRGPVISNVRAAPRAHDVLTKSPNPSIAQQAASANGETKNALARCAGWCSMLCTRGSRPTARPAPRRVGLADPDTLRDSGVDPRRGACRVGAAVAYYTFRARCARGIAAHGDVRDVAPGDAAERKTRLMLQRGIPPNA